MKGHITKYGNYYTKEEWDEVQDFFRREAQEQDDEDEKVNLVISTAGKMLEKAGILDPKTGQGYGIAYRIYMYGLDGIEFSTPEKEVFVKEVNAWMMVQ